MEDLTYFYQNPPIFGEILNRKKNVVNKKTIIKGAFNCGKSYFAFKFLKEFSLKNEKILYIDLDDLRADLSNIFLKLENFLEQNKAILALCIENLNEQIDFDFNKLKLLSIIITSQNKNLSLKNFDELEINGLDFEEFIAFYNKNLEQSSLFSQFLIFGNGVKNSKFSNHQIIPFLQNLIKSKFNKSQILILKQCAKQLGKDFSSNEIYKEVKKSEKISKDFIYKNIKHFENSYLIDFCPHFNKNKKKLFFYDFSLKSALNYQKDFHSSLQNALFCELKKLNLDIYYDENFDFLLPKKELALLLIPFSEVDLIYLKFKKLFPLLKQRKIKNLKVITITKQGNYFLEGIKCQILPFWQYCISL